MKKLLLAISIFSGTVVYAVTPPTTNYLSNIAVPNCTMTASYTANGSQEIGRAHV